MKSGLVAFSLSSMMVTQPTNTTHTMKFTKTLAHYSDDSGRFKIWPMTSTSGKTYAIEIDGQMISGTFQKLIQAKDVCRKIKELNPVTF